MGSTALKSSVSTLCSFKILTILWLLSVSACTSYSSGERGVGSAKSSQNVHTVVRGETLSSVARLYGLEYKKLAELNNIAPPYVVYPGQKIVFALKLSSNSSKVENMRKKSTISAEERDNSSSNNKTKKIQIAPNKQHIPSTFTWQWPSAGKIIALFGGETAVNKGIDLSGKLGEPVLAAAAGQVVYAGGGLRGYGKLLIIKHNDTFLSAYAHNNELLVEEGDFVKVGQRIADMGSSGTDRVKLHFEIRSEGNPVDPLKYLPKR